MELESKSSKLVEGVEEWREVPSLQFSGAVQAAIQRELENRGFGAHQLEPQHYPTQSGRKVEPYNVSINYCCGQCCMYEVIMTSFLSLSHHSILQDWLVIKVSVLELNFVLNNQRSNCWI